MTTRSHMNLDLRGRTGVFVDHGAPGDLAGEERLRRLVYACPDRRFQPVRADQQVVSGQRRAFRWRIDLLAGFQHSARSLGAGLQHIDQIGPVDQVPWKAGRGQIKAHHLAACYTIDEPHDGRAQCTRRQRFSQTQGIDHFPAVRTDLDAAPTSAIWAARSATRTLCPCPASAVAAASPPIPAPAMVIFNASLMSPLIVSNEDARLDPRQDGRAIDWPFA